MDLNDPARLARLILNSDRKLPKRQHKIAIFDPGESTGFVIFDGLKLIAADVVQRPNLTDFLSQLEVDRVIAEDFRLFPGKAMKLSLNDIPAAKVLGIIEAWCHLNKFLFIKQPPGTGKALITNDFLIRLDFNLHDISGAKRPHILSALRHGLYYIIFKLSMEE